MSKKSQCQVGALMSPWRFQYDRRVVYVLERGRPVGTEMISLQGEMPARSRAHNRRLARRLHRGRVVRTHVLSHPGKIFEESS